TTVQAGLAALVEFDAARTADENAAPMTTAAEAVSTGAVAIASRDADSNGVAIRKGAWLGLADGEPVAVGESFEDVARAVLGGLLAEPREIVTLLAGEDAPPLDRLLAEVAATHPGLELEVHEGGQPHYALLLAAE